MKHLAVPFDVVSRNNRMYTRDSFNGFVQPKQMFITLDYGDKHPYVELDNVIGKNQHCVVTDQGVKVEWELLDTPKGIEVKNALHNMKKEDFVIRPACTASISIVDGVQVITNADILSFALLPKERDSFFFEPKE